MQLDIPSGVLTFLNPLPAAGTLELGYFVGVWDVSVERFKATVHLDVAAADGAAVERSAPPSRLRSRPGGSSRPEGFRSIEPRALSASTPIPGLVGSQRTQRLTYAVEFESIEPVIPSSGGPIRAVDVDSILDPIVIAPPTRASRSSDGPPRGSRPVSPVNGPSTRRRA